MSYEGYLCLAGTEVGNAQRVLAYVRRGLAGSRWTAEDTIVASLVGDDTHVGFDPPCPCPGLGTFADYVSPGDDEAPWWEPARSADASDFLGFLPDSIEALPVSARSVAPRGDFGGVLGRARLRHRVVQVTGVLVAASNGGMEYGKRWLAEVLRGSLCEPLRGDSAEVLPACPPEGTSEEDAEDWLRRLYGVGLVDGPTFEAEGDVPRCHLQRASFQLVASNPYLHTLPAVVVDHEEVHGEDLTVDDAEVGTGQNEFEFVGTWGSSAGSDPYNGAWHYSKVTNDYWRLRWSGTQVKVFTAKGPNLGIVAFSVDGDAEETEDLFSNPGEAFQLVWTSPVYEDGDHELVCRVTGTKNGSSSDYFGTGDRVDITRTAVSAQVVTDEWPGDVAVAVEIGAVTDLTDIVVSAVPMVDDQECPATGVQPCVSYRIPDLAAGDVLVIDAVERVVSVTDASSKTEVSGYGHLDIEGPFSWVEVPPCSSMCVSVAVEGTGSAEVTISRSGREL